MAAILPQMLHAVAFAEFVVCWFGWVLAFIVARRRLTPQKKVIAAPVSRWGIFLQCFGFMFVYLRVRPAGFEKSPESLIVSMIVGPCAVWLAWVSVRHLGKQWRLEAALSEDHDLVRSGPYRWIRHPIYASMLGMLLSAGCLLTWWPMFLTGLAVFLTGTEVRVRIEDRLLADRFGQSFDEYRARTPALIPLVR